MCCPDVHHWTNRGIAIECSNTQNIFVVLGSHGNNVGSAFAAEMTCLSR